MVDHRTNSNVVCLNGSNFPTWKIQIKMVLMKQGVWKIVEGTEVAPDENNVAAWNKFNDRKDKALSSLVLSLDISMLYLLGSDPEDPIVVWNKLCDQFQKKTWSNKLVLRRKLLSLKPNENESIQTHIKAMVETFDALSVIGEAVEEEDRVVHILASLPEKYNMLVTALEACPEVPKLEVVTEKLLNEERKMKEKQENISRGSVFNSGHDALLVNSQNKSNNCFYCGKAGHKIRFCEQKRLDEEEKKNKESKRPEVANFSFVQNPRKRYDSDSSNECIALVSEVRHGSRWVMDSAATNHMCSDRSQMQNLQRLEKVEHVKVGNGDYIEAKFEGSVKLKVKHGKKVRTFKLSNVLFVPDMEYNLLSIPKASQAEKIVKFDKFGCEIIDPSSGEVLGSATKVGNLYYVNVAEISENTRKENARRSNIKSVNTRKESMKRNEMEKAIESIRENNFKEEMMRRLSSMEEDKTKINLRLNAVEEDVSNYTYMKEDNADQIQEDMQISFCTEVQEIDFETKESDNIQEDINWKCSGGVEINENKKIRSDEVSKVEVRGKFKRKFDAFKKSCSKLVRRHNKSTKDVHRGGLLEI